MKKALLTINAKLCIILFVLLSSKGMAQDVPFNCDYNAYLFQYNDVYAIDLASGNAYQVAADVTPGNINGAAYNPADGFIWGSLSSPQKSIVRIGKNFETVVLTIDELPTTNRYVGAISAEGVYFLKGGGTTYYKIDLDPDSSSYTQHIATENLSVNINVHDWAFNAVDGQLYAVEKNSNALCRIDPTNGVVQVIGEIPILAGLNYTYGAVYFDASGRFYVSANQTGTIYVIQDVQNVQSVNDIDSNLFAFGPSSSLNDGARCPTAPVPQEDCSNGIDDDGDGLVDCEDPSCSGFGTCDVIDAPTSGNDGGLESNGRLSEAINKRNFDRAKRGFKFDRTTARRVERTPNHGIRRSNNDIQLQDFIPLQVIEEDYVVESSPSDLVNITNATEVFSVDYIRNDSSIASILALTTENGVYEHTKYICDRLLGAELISVSTIDINDHAFIKSIVKNVDGSYEYVLGFSAKAVNDNTNFGIESHWNLDKYESNVAFYNFQVWTNNIDDLYRLGKEVLNLLEIQKPIVSYENSMPPTVYVRKGKYVNGGLDLQVVNTNGTETVDFDAGLRQTETSEFVNIATDIALGQAYITNIQVPTGNLFDIGFRIGDGQATPDDLFMSDGPWGYDDAQPNTLVNSYDITPNDIDYGDNDFPIERNVHLNATTNTYFAAYRALSPRFTAVDLSSYDSFALIAKGTGDVEITIVKQGVPDWSDQFKFTLSLSESFQEHIIPIADFVSNGTSGLELDDVTTIVFTMSSADGSRSTHEMNLQHIRFSNMQTLSVTMPNMESNSISAVPNPMSDSTMLLFNANNQETMELVIYDQIGKLVKRKGIEALTGKNTIAIDRDNLSPGLYFCKIISSSSNYKPLKLLIK